MSTVESYVETEVEWRVRLTLREAQRVLNDWFRGSYCIVDEFRLRKHAGFIRRVGSRVHHHVYQFDTLLDYITLNGLATVEDARSKHGRDEVDYFSEVKTTNCAHVIFCANQCKKYEVFDERKIYKVPENEEVRQQLLLDNRWPQLFVLKRSLELHDAVLHVESLEQVSDIENDKSDNNLGASVVRKIYRYIETRDTSTGNVQEIRIAIYSFLDEFQQVRYELSVEHEFPDCQRYESPFFSATNENMNPAPPSDEMCCSVVRVTKFQLQKTLDALSFISRQICATSLIYYAPTMPILNTDWTNQDNGPISHAATSTFADSVVENDEPSQNDDQTYQEDNDLLDDEDNELAENTSTSDLITHSESSIAETNRGVANKQLSTPSATSLNGKLLSYTMDVQENGSLTAFMRYVTNYIFRGIKNGSLILRRKIDGERVYATFDGDNKLHLENGTHFHLDKQDAHFFSPNFIYQFEHLANSTSDSKYILTEVVSVRNNYSHEPNALLHSFSPSICRYQHTPEQQWPYGLDCTGLSDEEIRRLLAFWSCSACAMSASNKLYEKCVSKLRSSSRKPCHNFPQSCVCLNRATTNTHKGFGFAVNGNHNFTDLSLDESLSFLDRINRCTSQRVLVNTQIHIDEIDSPSTSLLFREIESFYRQSVLRLTDILYENLLVQRGREMLFLHFDEREATHYHETYLANYTTNNNQYRPRLTSTIAPSFQQQVPIDGYLLYPTDTVGEQPLSPKACECTTVARSPCCYDPTLVKRHGIGNVAFKFKPFQTIELLCQIRATNRATDLFNVYFCVRASISEQQQDINSQAYLVAKNVPLIAGRKIQTGSISWENILGCSVNIYCSLSVALTDQQLYEFVVYNETTFFLVSARSDKIVPDSEKKINSIVYRRKHLTKELNRYLVWPT